MEWFEKLKRAKELLDEVADKGSDYIRHFAQFQRRIAEALEEAANQFDPTPGKSVVLGNVNAQEVEKFLEECKNEASQPNTSVVNQSSGWKEIGLTLLIELIRKILERRKQQP